MPRLIDTLHGVVVDVDDETAESLGAAYKPAPARKPAQAKTDEK